MDIIEISDSDDFEFLFQTESSGFFQSFCTFVFAIDALQNGKVLLIDEFGSLIHTEVSGWILKQFKSSSNPNNAQLIVNTQDLMLMDTDSNLRRDQIFFSDKDVETRSSEFYSLSDFKGVRKDMDIRKCYLIGRFDSMPFIENRDLL